MPRFPILFLSVDRAAANSMFGNGTNASKTEKALNRFNGAQDRKAKASRNDHRGEGWC